MTARRTEPTGPTLLQGRPYVNAANTDIRVRFAQLKQAAEKPKPVRLARSR